ncbi:MAG: FAD-binding oxidoreductase [Verrucomicrobiae bacterium]|nr:FAD-binding oxidoreductase [Verrucomicrobiae bacterium]
MKFRSSLQGRLILPGDESYETAKRVFYWNPRTESQPVGIVQCRAEEDAIRAVAFAREHGLEIAVRSGGHSHLAWGSSNGLVIDLSPLKKVTIDPERRIVRAQAGVTGGEVARAAGVHGLAPVLGQCPGVSATGVTLGGGLGWLAGRFGACCDQLVSARLVNADARTLDVNGESDPDLFWALRGAGANFGVTTSFEANLQSIGPVLGGDIHFAPRDARAVLQGFREIMHDAPDGFQATLNLTRGERGLFLGFCHSGPEAEGEGLLNQFRSIASPTKEIVNRQPYATLAEKAAATNPGTGAAPAFRAIQTVYRDRISDDVIEIYVDQLARATPDVVFGLSHYMHGEVCRVAPEATAFPHRQAHSIHLRMAHNWSDPDDTEKRFAWGEEWLSQLRPKTEEKLYSNYQTYETAVGSPSLFGPNHARLMALKSKHDPENIFHRNANITPERI